MGSTDHAQPLNYANGDHLMGRIGARKFIEIWQTSGSLSEVAIRTSIKKTSCTVRAALYRRKGIPLKKFEKRRDRLDYQSLADYAQQIGEENND